MSLVLFFRKPRARSISCFIICLRLSYFRRYVKAPCSRLASPRRRRRAHRRCCRHHQTQEVRIGVLDVNGGKGVGRRERYNNDIWGAAVGGLKIQQLRWVRGGRRRLRDGERFGSVCVGMLAGQGHTHTHTRGVCAFREGQIKSPPCPTSSAYSAQSKEAEVRGFKEAVDVWRSMNERPGSSEVPDPFKVLRGGPRAVQLKVKYQAYSKSHKLSQHCAAHLFGGHWNAALKYALQL